MARRRGDISEFFHDRAAVVGLTKRNADGSDRLAIARRLRVGDQVDLERDLAHPRDPNAVAVLDKDGAQVGYLAAAKSESVGPQLEEGMPFYAFVAEAGFEKGKSPRLTLLILESYTEAGEAAARREAARELGAPRSPLAALARFVSCLVMAVLLLLVAFVAFAIALPLLGVGR